MSTSMWGRIVNRPDEPVRDIHARDIDDRAILTIARVPVQGGPRQDPPLDDPRPTRRLPVRLPR